MKQREILTSKQLDLTIDRLCYQLIENHNDFADSVILGLQPRGTFLAELVTERIKKYTGITDLKYGRLDVTFYRDDFRRREDPLTVNSTQIDFLIEGKRVVLIDDVLYTGRTIRSGLDAMMDFGRPEDVEFLVLIDRRFSRQLPIQANYVGRTVDAISSERVDVIWEEGKGKVVLNTLDPNE